MECVLADASVFVNTLGGRTIVLDASTVRQAVEVREHIAGELGVIASSVKLMRGSQEVQLHEFVGGQGASEHLLAVIRPNPGRGCRLVGQELMGREKYKAMALALNGKLYAVPFDAKHVLEIDPDDCSVREIGETLDGEAKYCAIALGANGRLYAPPFKAKHVLEIDPYTSTVQRIGMTIDGNNSYCSVVAAANGKIYAPPFCANRVLEIDPAGQTVGFFGSGLQGTSKFVAIVDSGMGRLYAPPAWASKVLEIDLNAASVQLIGPMFAKGNADSKYMTAVMAPNGHIIAPPYRADLCAAGKILDIDPATSMVDFLPKAEPLIPGVAAATLSSNGRIYAPPADSKVGRVLEVDANSRTACLIGEVLPKGAEYRVVAEAGDGKLYAAPYGPPSMTASNNLNLRMDCNRVLQIDPDIGSTERLPPLRGLLMDGAYISMICAPNGRLFAPPMVSRQVLQVLVAEEELDVNESMTGE